MTPIQREKLTLRMWIRNCKHNKKMMRVKYHKIIDANIKRYTKALANL